MASPSRGPQFSNNFIETQAKYEGQLNAHILASSLPHGGGEQRRVEQAEREKKKFLEFLDALTFFVKSGRDPASLPIARNPVDLTIPGYHLFQRSPWLGYLFRDARDSQHPCATAVLMFHEDHEPLDLQTALEMANRL
jgi:hypothetical protein